MASNFCKLHYLAYLMEYSCLKTLASKHKTSLSKTIDKFNDGTGKWGIPYETKQGNKRRYFANYADCKGKGPATDYISNAAVVYGYAVNTLENRLKAKVCELCGTTESATAISTEIRIPNFTRIVSRTAIVLIFLEFYSFLDIKGANNRE